MEQKLTIGRIVHYVLSKADAEQINRRRVKNATRTDAWVPGSVAHVGNEAREGQIFPAMVTAVFDGTTGQFNGQLFLDGNDTLWITSVHQDEGGKEPEWTAGTWHWPPRA